MKLKLCCLTALAVFTSACGKTGLNQLNVPQSDGGDPLPDGGIEPVPSLHATFTLKPTYEDPPFLLQRPTRIDGLVTLTLSGRDVTGTLALLGTSTITSLVAVRGTLDGATVTLEPGEAAVRTLGSLGWASFTLELVEGGEGTASGKWSGYGGDVIDQSSYTATLTASRDTTGAAAALEPLLPDPYRALLLPIDGVRVRVREPVSEAAARTRTRLVVAGQPQPSATTTTAIEGRVTTLELRPDAWLPFDSEVSVELGGLSDPVGNAIVNDKAVHRTVADPGTMLANGSFEQGLTGWSKVGRDATVRSELHGVTPAAGAQLLVIREDSAVAGWFDVPASATQLSFSAALFSEGGHFDAGRTMTVTLYAAGRAPQRVFDGKDEASKGVDCDGCLEFGKRVPLERHSADISALRGQRVYLVAEVRSSYFFGVTQFALVLDDVRLE